MNLLLFNLLLFLTLYPIVKLLIYMPLNHIVQDHKKSFAYSLTGTGVVLGGFILIFFGMTSQFQIMSIYNNGILNMGSLIIHSMIPVVSAVTIFCSIVLIILSIKFLKVSNDYTKTRLFGLRFDILFCVLTVAAHVFVWFIIISLNQALME